MVIFLKPTIRFPCGHLLNSIYQQNPITVRQILADFINFHHNYFFQL